MSTSLTQLRSRNQTRLAEEKRVIDRKRNTMILILHHCIDHGYLDTAERLQAEAGVTLSKFHVADNIDLDHILQEYEDYYEFKFSKKPKLVRRIASEEEKGNASAIDTKKAAAAERRNRRQSYTSASIPKEARVENSTALRATTEALRRKLGSGTKSNHGNASNNQEESSDDGQALDLGLVGQKPASRSSLSPVVEHQDPPKEEDVEDRMLKPLPCFGTDSELQGLAENITRDIFQRNPNVRWDDVVELHDAKRLLKEAVVMPIKYPQLFTGLLSPWCGILLFGPPGTGKTMLAKAVATECRTTFFNISASSIVSKYRGDSEKLVRMLFELARYHAPSTIFLDEIDSMMGQRGEGGGGQEHEASRRMKTELLIQMDGLAKSNELVFVLAASNLPWELDMAMLRRLEKRVLVPLPGPSARELMLEKSLGPYLDHGSITMDHIVEATEGYSGADLKLVAKEAAMGPVRRLMRTMEEASEAGTEVHDDDGDNGPSAVSSGSSWQEMLEKVSQQDLDHALEKTKPSAFRFAPKYQSWQQEFGST